MNLCSLPKQCTSCVVNGPRSRHRRLANRHHTIYANIICLKDAFFVPDLCLDFAAV